MSVKQKDFEKKIVAKHSFDDEECNFSNSTIRAPTPSVNDVSVENFAMVEDATTPVLPDPLPPLPPSPRIFSELPSASLGSMPTRDFTRKSKSLRMPSSADKKREKKNIGTVIGDYVGIYQSELTLKIGEKIEIISKDTEVSRNIGWWTGRNLKGQIGIFPAACVCSEPLITKNIQGSLKNTDYSLEIHSSEVDIKEVIGIGGFGKVYSGIYCGEVVAVKVAKTTTYDSLKAVQEVISEAEKFAHLAHQNICALIGVVLVKDVCLIMEYARGGSLSEVIHKHALSLPVGVILDWSTQIASGLAYLHHEAEPSLIHRDIKSGNSK